MTTVLHRLAAWADSDPTSIAQKYKKNGNWEPVTAREYCDSVYWLALFLESRGMTSQDVGTILSYNCREWVYMDLAVLLLGAKSAGIYPNSIGKEILYVLNHTESRFLAVQNKAYFEKITANSTPLPATIKMVLVFDGDTSFSPLAVSFRSAVEEGKKLAEKKDSKKLKDYLSKLDPKVGCFMIYTSGTTGNPKGALLSHDNLVYTVDRVAEYWGLPVGGASLFSFLPLCHIAEKIQNLGAGISLRYTVNYCTAFDNVSKELPETEPGLLLCVPRLWEKMMEGVLAKVNANTGIKKALPLWALSVGHKAAEARYGNGSLSVFDRLQWVIAERLVLSKVRKALGLGKAEALASGAAALPAYVCRWFRSLNLEIMEVFGQTESTGVVCMTQRGVDSAGTVGQVVKGLELKIAEDGEILARGRHVFVGYYKDDAATQQVLEGGWLHTGDLGEMDSKGFIKIRGRKKEILKTSGGKMIAPLPIEEALKTSPIISQVCMVGDGRKYLSALITLSETKLSELKLANGTLSNLIITAPKVLEEVKKYVDELNSTLSGYEQIKKFAVLSREFSIADGEMTPTLKMKRNVIEKRFQDVIQKFYE